MAEREARKQAKLNAKLKTKSANNDKDTKPSEVLPVNARNLEETLVDRSLDEKAAGKSKAELRAERRAKQVRSKIGTPPSSLTGNFTFSY